MDEFARALKNEAHDLRDVIERLRCLMADDLIRRNRLEVENANLRCLIANSDQVREDACACFELLHAKNEHLQTELDEMRHQFTIYNEQRLGALAEIERLQAEAAVAKEAVYKFDCCSTVRNLYELGQITTAGQSFLDRKRLRL